MIGIGFIWAGAVIFLWLLIFTLIAYTWPDSVAANVLSIVK